ncbi:MAG TPA: haloacid dehalogenase-like hydrolase [Candidatus Elarobacter sp.]|nr:haloacid dehalogenase-like hydrolase [Candidatus Elarobacter sp.]
MQIVVDWDGTATERDSLLLILEHFLPPALFATLESELDAALAARTMTHREVMELEWDAMMAPLDAIVAFVVERVRLRRGFASFFRAFDPLILSSSFYETIEPVLARDGVVARVRANHLVAVPGGWRIDWQSDAECDVCGEACKRASLPQGPFVYVGDGYSDRCAALAAERVFARDRLARYLDEQGVAYEPFDDFDQIADALTR